MVHARHVDRRWSRQLQYQQTKNQELQKNMVALASQMKGLEEEAMKKLKVQQPYSALPPPLVAVKTPSASTDVSISAGASPKTRDKDEREVEGGDKVVRREKLSESADISTIGAAKPDTDISYGERRVKKLNFVCLSEFEQKWYNI